MIYFLKKNVHQDIDLFPRMYISMRLCLTDNEFVHNLPFPGAPNGTQLKIIDYFTKKILRVR